MKRTYRYLFLVPARKGSKRVPGKNKKLLLGKPLIKYTLDFIEKVVSKEDLICLNTDDEDIIKISKQYSLNVLKRPKSLAKDITSMENVIRHTLLHYIELKIKFKAIILLQPTSPIREISDFRNLLKLYNREKLDLVVSVKLSKENPYYLLYEKNSDGFIEKSKPLDLARSQCAPFVYCLNGAFFMYNVKSLQEKPIKEFKKIKKFEMPFERSIDIDDQYDWELTEFFMRKLEDKKNKNNI
jgi:CMP-N,N'-diacetyllegionaminic acid synthase